MVFELIGGLENNLPAPHMHASSMEVNPAPPPPEEDGEEDEGRRVLSEVLEEDAPPNTMRFSNRPVHALFKSPPALEFIQKVFKVMNECPHLIFQVLTKRGERLEEVWKHWTWSENIWMGVSVENELVTQPHRQPPQGSRRREIPFLRTAHR